MSYEDYEEPERRGDPIEWHEADVEDLVDLWNKNGVRVAEAKKAGEIHPWAQYVDYGELYRVKAYVPLEPPTVVADRVHELYPYGGPYREHYIRGAIDALSVSNEERAS